VSGLVVLSAISKTWNFVIYLKLIFAYTQDWSKMIKIPEKVSGTYWSANPKPKTNGQMQVNRDSEINPEVWKNNQYHHII